MMQYNNDFSETLFFQIKESKKVFLRFVIVTRGRVLLTIVQMFCTRLKLILFSSQVELLLLLPLYYCNIIHLNLGFLSPPICATGYIVEGTVCTLTCQTGFGVRGARRTQCLTNGDWSETVFYCKGK